MSDEPILTVVFFRNDAQKEPVREWLKDLGEEGKKAIGKEIKTIQFGWPNEMPRNLVKKLKKRKNLWEVRSNFKNGRQPARILFTVKGNEMVILHGFFKGNPREVNRHLDLAGDRKSLWEGGNVWNE